MSFPNANLKSPILSPSLNEYGEALYTDEAGNVLETFAAIVLDANGHSNLGSAVVGKGHASQVTGRQQSAIVTTPAGEKVRMVALVSLDSTGAPIPFAPASAGSVSGKFQSTELTGTGSSQNVAHGLGVVPSLVLAAIQDTNGVALPIAMAEGVHDATNLKITVTSGVKFKIIAFA